MAACSKPAMAASASTTENKPVAASLNYIGQVSENTTMVYNPC